MGQGVKSGSSEMETGDEIHGTTDGEKNRVVGERRVELNKRKQHKETRLR